MKNKELFKRVLFLPIISLFSLFSLAGCTTTPSEEEKDWVDYAKNSDVKLTLDYVGHEFLEDGIGEVKLETAIDGDTAHFVSATSEDDTLIKARFYGIDTPESTGKIQEYGKAASNYTKEKLLNANENGTIVLSSPFFEYREPEADSTGSRYVSLVWINEDVKNAPIEDLYCLNLMIVQEGFSWIKGLEDIPEFVETFTAAESQARDFKLNLFSGEPDPLFNYGEYKDISLLDLKNEVVKSLKDPNYENIYDNERVRIQGTVAGFADHILYLQGYFDEETGSTVEGGEYAGINIFTGMSSIPSKYYTVNNYIQLCGVAQDNENFGFQISGVVNFPMTAPKDENDTRVIFTSDEIDDSLKVNTFEFAPNELKSENYDVLFSPVTLTEEVIVSGGYDGDDSITLYLTDKSGNEMDYNVYIPFMYRPDPTDPIMIYDSYEDFLGQSFSVNNAIYNFHKTQSGNIIYQLIPVDSTGFALVNTAE